MKDTYVMVPIQEYEVMKNIQENYDEYTRKNHEALKINIAQDRRWMEDSVNKMLEKTHIMVIYTTDKDKPKMFTWQNAWKLVPIENIARDEYRTKKW